MEKFTLTGFLLRLTGALAIVLLTFNPTGHSYYHWIADGFPSIAPVEAVVGVALLIAWVVLLTATARSIGVIGIALAIAFFAAVIWLMTSWEWFDPRNPKVMTWVGLSASAIVLAIGMSWSHVRRRLTGQSDVDQVDEK